MATMKAALYQGKRKLKVATIPRPEPGPGEALVRVRAEGVCGSDLLIWWDKKEKETLPAGHEVAGEIVAPAVVDALEIAPALAGLVQADQCAAVGAAIAD